MSEGVSWMCTLTKKHFYSSISSVCSGSDPTRVPHQKNWGKKAAVVPPPPPPHPSSPSLPSLIMPNATRPHHRKIHSHRSLRPAAVATIILEEETLAINYMCAFHLLFCGGEPSEDWAEMARWASTRVTRCQHRRRAPPTTQPHTDHTHPPFQPSSTFHRCTDSCNNHPETIAWNWGSGSKGGRPHTHRFNFKT